MLGEDMSLTVAEMVNAGREMNRVRDDIQNILDGSQLSIFHKAGMLYMIAFEYMHTEGLGGIKCLH